MNTFRVHFTRTVHHIFDVQAESHHTATQLVRDMTNENSQTWESAQDYWIEDEVVKTYVKGSAWDTQTSGYWLDNVAVTDPPAEPCPICNDTQENCPACPPADDAQYMRAWRAGAFDDELEAAFYVGYERLLEGAE